jgi:hypothetical protein
MIVTHFGINNQTSPMEEPQDLLELVGMEPERNQVFFHDAWNEYALVLPEKRQNSV